MTVILNDTLGVFGGSHTLMLRMCRWMREKNISVFVICDSDDNKEIAGAMRDIGVIIYPTGSSLYREINKVLKQIYSNGDDDIHVINFCLDKFMDMEVVKSKFGYEFSNVLYDIIPYTYMKGSGLKYAFLRRLMKRKYGKIAEKMYKNNSVISMEETNNQSARNYLGITREQYNPSIAPLPMICKEKDNYKKIISAGYQSTTILTAARADFPFKGYMVGLVDVFAQLKAEFPDLKLRYITAGADLSVLEEKIDTLPVEYRKDVLVTGWIPYDEFLNETQNCKIFVGMGTTILDSALNYKPVILSAYGTMDFLTCGTFVQNPLKLGPEVLESHDPIDDIRKILLFSESDYEEESVDSFNTVLQHYDINKCMNMLLNVKQKKSGPVLSRFEVDTRIFKTKLDRIRFRHSVDKNSFAEVEKTQDKRG